MRAVVAALAAAAAAADRAAPAAGRVRFDERARRNAAGWAVGAAADPSAAVSLVFGLVTPRGDELDALAAAVSDPASPRYAAYLSRAEIAARFAPGDAAVRAAADELRRHAAAVVVSPLRDFIRAALPAGRAAELLGAPLCEWAGAGARRAVRTCGGTAFTLPAAVAAVTAYVDGAVGLPAAPRRAAAAVRSGSGTPVSDPASLKSVYGVPPTLRSNGTQRQAVFAADGQYFAPSDLDSFFTDVYPTNTTPPHPPVTVVGRNVPDKPGGEATLDLEYIMAMGLDAETVFLNKLDQDVLLWTAVFEWLAGQEAPPGVLSISYGMAEHQVQLLPGLAQAWGNGFKKQALRGVTFVIASGDNGADCRAALTGDKFAPTYPSGSPYVLSVGGTQLDPRANWTYQVTAQFSGGGFSNAFDAPAWQQGAVAGYLAAPNVTLPPQGYWKRGGRGFPDVSLVGDNCQIWVGGSAQTAGGTSISAPQMAGLLSLVNSRRAAAGKPAVGAVGPLLYAIAAQHSDAFVDIVDGRNDGQGGNACGGAGFEAAPGWDPATGLGAPNFPRLLQYMLQA